MEGVPCATVKIVLFGAVGAHTRHFHPTAQQERAISYSIVLAAGLITFYYATG